MSSVRPTKPWPPPNPKPIRCRMTTSKMRAIKMIINTFTQRGVLGVDPGLGGVFDKVFSPRKIWDEPSNATAFHGWGQ
jgi:hypothetical protein